MRPVRHNAITDLCRLCLRVGHLKGERDPLSPYCGTCDPDGRLFYESKLVGGQILVAEATAAARRAVRR